MRWTYSFVCYSPYKLYATKARFFRCTAEHGVIMLQNVHCIGPTYRFAVMRVLYLGFGTSSKSQSVKREKRYCWVLSGVVVVYVKELTDCLHYDFDFKTFIWYLISWLSSRGPGGPGPRSPPTKGFPPNRFSFYRATPLYISAVL